MVIIVMEKQLNHNLETKFKIHYKTFQRINIIKRNGFIKAFQHSLNQHQTLLWRFTYVWNDKFIFYMPPK